MDDRAAEGEQSPVARAVAELRGIQWELSEITRRIEELQAQVSDVEAVLSEGLPEEERRHGSL